MASTHFLQQLLKECQSKYLAVQDTDYPHLVLNSIRLDGFDESGIVDAALVEQQLQQGIVELNRVGVEAIVIPCNTVHLFYTSMLQVSVCPIFNLIEETCARAQSLGYKRVGILASESNLKSELYQKELEKRGLTVLVPSVDSYSAIGQTIEAVMGNRHGAAEQEFLSALIEDFKRQGAEAVILGCTELPLAISKNSVSLPLIDSLEVLVKVALRFAYEV